MRVTSLMALAVSLVLVGPWSAADASAKEYELTRNNVQKATEIDSMTVSLYGIRLGSSEIDTVERLVNERIPGVRAEQEGVFILLWDQSNPTGAMAGVRIMDSRVDLLFINNRFVHKTRGIFRRVLTAQSANEIRELLGPEDVGDENVMGARLDYQRQGFLVNYLGRDINVEFELP